MEGKGEREREQREKKEDEREGGGGGERRGREGRQANTGLPYTTWLVSPFINIYQPIAVPMRINCSSCTKMFHT